MVEMKIYHGDIFHRRDTENAEINPSFQHRDTEQSFFKNFSVSL